MADQSCVWRVCGLSLQPIDCTPTLYVTQSASAAAVRVYWTIRQQTNSVGQVAG